VTAAVLAGGGDDPPKTPIAAATNPELLPIDPPRAEPPALLPVADPPAPQPQPVPPVSLQINTGTVVATVLDGDGRVLGTTDVGVSVPRGAEPIALVLRADGYQDLPLEVTPDRDQTIDRAGALRKRPAGKPDKAPTKSTPTPTKKPPDNSDLMPLD
jgi:hypothetical protein